MFSLSPFTLRNYKKSKNRREKLIAHLLARPRELLVTIMILNVFSNILVQNTVSSLFEDLTSWGLKVGLPLALTLIFGEIIPKSVALPNNQTISYQIAPFISSVAKVLGPIRIFLTKITGYVSRIMFFFLRKEKEISHDELEHVLKTSQDRGILDIDEFELMGGYLDLQDSVVKERMRPRDEILFYDINDPIDTLMDLFVKKECSRVPVCDEDLDKIIGIISVRGFFFHREHIKAPEDLRSCLIKPFFVPETMNAYSLLHDLREMKENIAMVVDEYGSIIGLIAQEDLIEIVVGEISDRREKSHYTRSSKDVIIASGKLELEEIMDIFGVQLTNDTKKVTIGGWLTEQLSEIPQAGTKYFSDDFLFYVLASDPNRVRRVYIRYLKSKPPKKK